MGHYLILEINNSWYKSYEILPIYLTILFDAGTLWYLKIGVNEGEICVVGWGKKSLQCMMGYSLDFQGYT